MAKSINNETYTALVAAFREAPGNASHAAKVTGVTRRTAKKAWETGWPSKDMPSVTAVLEEEKLQARKQLAAEAAAKAAAEEREHELAVEAALKARKEEGTMVQLTRGQSLQTLTVAVQLGQSARAMAPSLKAYIEVEAKKLAAWAAYETGVLDGSIHPNDPQAVPPLAKPALSATRAAELLQKVATLNAQVVNTARQAMEMERLHLGEPTNLIGIAARTRDMTMDEAKARLEAANNAFEASERTHGAMVVDPGIDEPEVGELVTDL